jgi:bifunctional enzyme CysN/CysC
MRSTPKRSERRTPLPWPAAFGKLESVTVHRPSGTPENEEKSPWLACGSADDVDPIARAQMKGQRPLVLWFTGLSGSGKSTLARRVERLLARQGRHTALLDGDLVRQGLNRDLGFSDADRTENIRRVAEVSKLFVDAGLIVLVSCISPFRLDRDHARKLVGEGQFIEIFVDTPLDVCIARDPKGLYRKAIAGEIKNIAGIDTAYEAPASAEIVLKTTDAQPTVLAERVVLYLKNRAAG